MKAVDNQLARLNRFIAAHYDLEELRTLCFELGVDYDELGGEGKTAKVRELLLYFDRRDRISELIRIVEKLRPQIPWRSDPEKTQAHSLQLHTSLHEGLSEADEFTFALERYLERLQAYILDSFHQDHYIMLTVKTREFEDADTLWAIQQTLRSASDIMTEEIQGRGKLIPLEEAVVQDRLVTLLGDPGIGKTYSLRRLTLRGIEAFRTENDQQLPVWVSLSEWTEKEMTAKAFLWSKFAELFTHEEVNQRVFEHWIQQGALLLLLDGLNELPQLERESASPADRHDRRLEKHVVDPRVNGLFVLARDSGSRFILTSRIPEYAHLPGWQEFQILPMNEKQIASFSHQNLVEESERLEVILEQKPELRDLVRTPFNLQSVIRLIQEESRQVPTDRFRLVQHVCEAAIRREANRQQIQADQVINVLGNVSLHLMTKGVIGSSFSVRLEPGSINKENEHPGKIDLIEALLCAEGAGLLIRKRQIGKERWYDYHHQRVQEALALLHLQSEYVEEIDVPEVKALERVGEIHSRWGLLTEAQENLSRALELCPLVGFNRLRVSILVSLSRVLRKWRRTSEALRFAEQAVELLEGKSITPQLAEAYHELGDVFTRLRDAQRAEKNYQSSLDVYERLGESSEYAYEIIYGLASFYSAPFVYRIAEALRLYDKALRFFEQSEDSVGAAITRLKVAHAYRLWGEMEKAQEFFELCVEDFEKIQQPWLRLNALDFLGYTMRDLRRIDEALPFFEESLKLAKKLGSQIHQMHILVYGFAWAASYQNKHHRAFELVEQAKRLAAQQASPEHLIDIYSRGFAYILWRARDYVQAAEYFMLLDKVIDEESRLHLTLGPRLGIGWAKIIGRHTGKHLSARLISHFLSFLAELWLRLNVPSNWLGRQLWRLMWRSQLV